MNESNGEYPPANRGRNLRRHSHWRRVLTWGLAWVVGAQLSAVFYLEWRHPEFLDPKYGCRMLALRERRAAQPKRPLLLVLGSSRAEQGFRPALLAHSASEQDPFFYNMARGGSSPLLYLLTLRRLLADDVRPDCLLVEIFPPALADNHIDVTIYKPTLRDLSLLRRYPVSGRTWAFWLQDRLLLWHKYRSGFVARAAPQLLTPEARWGDHLWDYRGGEWRVLGTGVSPSEHRRLTDDAHRRYAPSLQNFQIDPDGDRALCELLDTCQTHRIGVVLFLMPEAREFRGWYPPETQGRLTDYLARLRRDYGVPLIDARRWIDDEEFSDSHHLLARGAAVFTRRFAAEVLSSPYHAIRTRTR